MDKYDRYQIIESRKTRDGIEYTVGSGSEIETLQFTDIRGAWAWPTDRSPFYWCLVAQEHTDTDSFDEMNTYFELVAEGIDYGLDLDTRFGALTDVSALYLCNFYADLSAVHEEEAAAYYDFQSKHSSKNGSLAPAPYADNFRLGVELTKSWVRERRLDIPKDTVVFDQLSRITNADLADRALKESFFAIETLRHVISSYKRDPVIHKQLQRPVNFSPHPGSWML